MGADTTIPWCDHTHNAWIGCTKVSTGPLGACEACYAEALDARHQWGIPTGERAPKGTAPHWGVGAPRHRTSESTRRAPFRWNLEADRAGRPAKVFAHSLSDFFDNEVPQEWREDEYGVWRATPWLRWIVLTKRPGLIVRMLPRDWGGGYPNVGFVASVSTQAELDRDAPKMLDVPARWHGLSIEPQLEHVDVRDWLPSPLLKTRRGDDFKSARALQWVITGGESMQRGHQPRRYDLAWPRDLVRQCRHRCAVFVKQVGSNAVIVSHDANCTAQDTGRDVRATYRHKAGADPAEWPEDLRVRQFPEALS